MTQRSSLIVIAVMLASLVRPEAQDKGAWFGTPVPPPLSDPRKPIMKHDDVFAPVPVQFVHRPGRYDELLDGAVLKTDQKKIVGFSLESLDAGDKVWGRRAATPAFMHTHRVDGQRVQGRRPEGRAGRNLRRARPRCGRRSRGSSGGRRSGVRRRHADGDAAVRVSAAGRRDDSPAAA